MPARRLPPLEDIEPISAGMQVNGRALNRATTPGLPSESTDYGFMFRRLKRRWRLRARHGQAFHA
jgi:hypothetical protein